MVDNDFPTASEIFVSVTSPPSPSKVGGTWIVVSQRSGLATSSPPAVHLTCQGHAKESPKLPFGIFWRKTKSDLGVSSLVTSWQYYHYLVLHLTWGNEGQGLIQGQVVTAKIVYMTIGSLEKIKVVIFKTLVAMKTVFFGAVHSSEL